MPVWSVLLRLVLCLALLLNSAAPAFAQATAMPCHAMAGRTTEHAGMHAISHAAKPRVAQGHAAMTGHVDDNVPVVGHRVATTHTITHHASPSLAMSSQDDGAADCCDGEGEGHHRSPVQHDDSDPDQKPHDCGGSGCDAGCARHCAAAMPLVIAVSAPVLPSAQPPLPRIAGHRAPPLHHLIRPPIA